MNSLNFERYFKKHPRQFASILENVMSDTKSWTPIEYAIVIFAGRLASRNRHGMKDVESGYMGSFSGMVEEGIETMLTYKHHTYLTHRGGAMLTNWEELSYLHGRTDEDQPILKRVEFYWGDRTVKFIPIITDSHGKEKTNTYIEVPYTCWIQPTYTDHQYGYPRKAYDEVIHTLDDYCRKIVPMLVHLWPIVDEFYSTVLMNPDLDDFDFTYNGVLYQPQEQDYGEPYDTTTTECTVSASMFVTDVRK